MDTKIIIAYDLSFVEGLNGSAIPFNAIASDSGMQSLESSTAYAHLCQAYFRIQ